MSRAPTPAEPTPEEPLGADPSMEDILASIRRILNEDDAPGSSPDAGPSPASAAPNAASAGAGNAPPSAEAVTGAGSAGEDEDVLVLDEGMLVNAPEPFAPEPPAAEALAVPPEPSLPTDATAPVGGGMLHDEGLLAPESAAAAASSVSSLFRTLSHERGAQVYRGGPTIEDLVREEIRPMLKAWLDEQLPPLVERLVRQEIERVAGRAGL